MPKQIAITDIQGTPTGEVMNIDDATRQGLWHQGAHVVIIAGEDHVLLQRRSPHAIQWPGALELSIGGFVDAGETPSQTIIRETLEESGIQLSPNDLLLIDRRAMTVRYRKDGEKRVSRTVLSSYIACIPHVPQLIQEESEVAKSRFITLKTTRRLVRWGRVRGVGRLMAPRSYHRMLMRHVRRELEQRKQPL